MKTLGLAARIECIGARSKCERQLCEQALDKLWLRLARPEFTAAKRGMAIHYFTYFLL